MMGYNPRVGRIIWTAALISTVLFAAYQIRETLFIFILAVFFSYMVYPLVVYLERHRPRRSSRTSSVALTYLLVVAILVTAFAVIGTQIAAQATRLAQTLPALARDPHWMDRLPLPHILDPVKSRIFEAVRDQAQSASDNAVPVLRRVGTEVVHYAGNIIFVVLIPILSFLLTKDAPLIRESILYWMGNERSRPVWEGILTDLHVLLSQYIRAVLLLSLASFTAYSAFLTLVGVPYSLLLAGIAGLLELIPLLGPLTAAAVILLVAGFTGYSHLLWLVVFLVGYRLLQDYVLSPYLMSSGVELHPLLVIFGVLAGEHLGGVPAMFLSIPVLAVSKITARRLREASEAKSLGRAPELHTRTMADI